VANWTVADDSKYLDRCMEELTRFLEYFFSEQHLNLDADTSSHRGRFGVNAAASDDPFANRVSTA
jgi:hypothetical protein